MAKATVLRRTTDGCVFPNFPGLAKRPDMEPVEIEAGQGISRCDPEGNPLDRFGNPLTVSKPAPKPKAKRAPAKKKAAKPDSEVPAETTAEFEDLMAGLDDGSDT